MIHIRSIADHDPRRKLGQHPSGQRNSSPPTNRALRRSNGASSIKVLTQARLALSSAQNVLQSVRTPHKKNSPPPTLYQALYSRTFRGLTLLAHHCLRSRRRRRRPRGYRTRLTQRPRALGPFKTIHQRPPSAAERIELGHWEGDLITGPANQSAVITLVERVTRFTILGYLATNHHAGVVSAVLTRLFADVAPELRRTLTWDRGNEMAAWMRLERDSGLAVYFCDPRSPWQRPTNEQNNGQLRYWLPKGQDLRRYSEHDLCRITDFLNNQPRRLLNWDTPAQRYAAATMH